MLTISAAFAGELGLLPAVGVMAALTIAYFVIMLVTRSFGKRTWTLNGTTDARDREPSAVP